MKTKLNVKTKFHKVALFSLLFVFNACTNESIDGEPVSDEPDTSSVFDNPPTGFEFTIIGDGIDNNNPQTLQEDKSQSLYTARESSNRYKLETPLKMEYLSLDQRSSMGLPIMKITTTEPGKGIGSNTNEEGYAFVNFDMKPYMDIGTSNLSNYIEDWEPLKFNRILTQVAMPKNMIVTDTHKQQWQIGSYFSSHPHETSYSSKEKDGWHGYYYIALPSIDIDLGGGRNAWITIVIDEKPNHFRGEAGSAETRIEDRWPLSVNENRNWLDANNRLYQKMDGNLGAFPHPDGNGSEVDFYFSQYAAFHVPNEYGESESKVRNMAATYHEDNEMAWVGFNSNKLITTGNYEARISNTSFHIEGWEETKSVSMGSIRDRGTSAYNTSRLSAKIPASEIGEGEWYFIAVKHSETENFRQIRIPSKNNF